MIDTLLGLVTGNGWLAGAIAVVAAIVISFFRGRSSAKSRQAAQTLKQVEAGRDGAHDARDDLDAGASPQEVVGKNDKGWTQ